MSSITYNPVTQEIKIDDPVQLVEDVAKRTIDFSKKIRDSRKQRVVKEHLEPRSFMERHRRQSSMLASIYYMDAGYELLDEQVPVLCRDELIPKKPIDINQVTLEWQPHEKFDFDSSFFAANNLLPFKEKRYSSFLTEFAAGINIFNAPIYRLLDTGGNKEQIKLSFGINMYFDYFDTCELVAYEFCKEILKKIKENKELTVDIVKNKTKLTLRDRIGNPFDFAGRSAAVGVNTVIIVIDDKKPKFLLHDRSGVLAEAPNTISVVPAGTFQPRAEHDSYHSQDFSLYTNLMREFGEELLGEKEFYKQNKTLSDIFDVDILKKVDFFIKRGVAHAYYLGMGIDCLTTKPEIFTALVMDRETVETFLWSKVTDCFEGESFEVELTRERLRSFIEHKDMVPAGAGCLWFLEKNFDFLKNSIQTVT